MRLLKGNPLHVSAYCAVRNSSIGTSALLLDVAVFRSKEVLKVIDCVVNQLGNGIVSMVKVTTILTQQDQDVRNSRVIPSILASASMGETTPIRDVPSAEEVLI